jgi:hypothetical protein
MSTAIIATNIVTGAMTIGTITKSTVSTTRNIDRSLPVAAQDCAHTVALSALGVVAIIVVAGAELLWPITRESGVVNAIGAGVIGVASIVFYKLERGVQQDLGAGLT